MRRVKACDAAARYVVRLVVECRGEPGNRTFVPHLGTHGRGYFADVFRFVLQGVVQGLDGPRVADLAQGFDHRRANEPALVLDQFQQRLNCPRIGDGPQRFDRCQHTNELESVKAVISDGTARGSRILPSAPMAAARTVESLLLSSLTNGSTATGVANQAQGIGRRGLHPVVRVLQGLGQRLNGPAIADFPQSFRRRPAHLGIVIVGQAADQWFDRDGSKPGECSPGGSPQVDRGMSKSLHQRGHGRRADVQQGRCRRLTHDWFVVGKCFYQRLCGRSPHADERLDAVGPGGGILGAQLPHRPPQWQHCRTPFFRKKRRNGGALMWSEAWCRVTTRCLRQIPAAKRPIGGRHHNQSEVTWGAR